MELKAYRPEMRGRDSRAAHLLLRVGSLKFFALRMVLRRPLFLTFLPLFRSWLLLSD